MAEVHAVAQRSPGPDPDAQTVGQAPDAGAGVTGQAVFDGGCVAGDHGSRVKREGLAFDRDVQHAGQPSMDVTDGGGGAVHRTQAIEEMLGP